jgi:hypothetical protein
VYGIIPYVKKLNNLGFVFNAFQNIPTKLSFDQLARSLSKSIKNEPNINFNDMV